MFQKLKTRINRSILFSSLLFTVLMGIVAFIFISLTLYRHFENAVNENINQSINRSNFVIQAAKDTTTQIAETSSIYEALTEESYNNKVNPILNTFKNTSYAITGVTIYTPHGIIYSTSSISSHLTLDEMKEQEGINRFLQSDEESYLSIRTSHINKIYNHVRYPEEYGMITYIVKLKNEQKQVIGYLFVDINPNYIYSNFFDYSDYHNFREVQSFIITEQGSYLRSKFNSQKFESYLNTHQTKEMTFSSNHRFLIVKKPIFTEQNYVVSIVPLAPFYRYMVTIGLIFLMVILLLNAIAYFISRKIANRIILPISNLYEEMTDRNSELNTTDSIIHTVHK